MISSSRPMTPLLCSRGTGNPAIRLHRRQTKQQVAYQFAKTAPHEAAPISCDLALVGESLRNGGVWENALPTPVLGFRSHTAQATLRRTREVLLPPKPKELESTTRTGCGRAWPAT